MPRHYIRALAFYLLCYLPFAAAHDRSTHEKKNPRSSHAHESVQPLSREQHKRRAHAIAPRSQSAQTIFHENFDNSAPDWNFLDLWRESFWHVSTTGAFAGKSYWAGIEALGGYDDAWLQTLTSPAITLPTGGGITLSFIHILAVEPLSGGYPHGYDAWDAVTVRLSTDAQNFNVIAPSSGPSYNAASAYGFHFYYGAGVAGWSGATNGWVASSFDLSAFAGKTIWLRFELASDEAYSHADDPALFGWRIDDIKISQNGAMLFFDDGGDTGAAKFVAGGPGGSSQWHLTNAAAHSFPNSAGCFNLPSGNYLSNAKTALVSPAIALKTLPANTRQLLADVQLQGNLDATFGADGNHDFLRAEYRSFRNGVWSYWENTGSTVTNLPTTFASFNAFYSSDLDLSAVLGRADSLQMRLVLFTAPDNAVLAPARVLVDDFTLNAVTTSANDVGVIDLDVPFPNVATFPAQRGVARVANLGLNSQTAIFFGHRVNAGTLIMPSLPAPLKISTNEQASATFDWFAPAPGNYTLTAVAALASDEYRANDSLTVAPITVYPEGMAELGYDDRFQPDQFITRTTSLVSFSVLDDLRGATSRYDLRRVRVDLFNASRTTEDRVRIVVATASDDTTIAEILLDVIEPVPADDFSAHVLKLDARDLIAPRVLVRVDFSVSNGNAGLVMDRGTRFLGRNFVFNGSRWVGSSFGRQIRALVTWLAAPDIISVRDVPNDQGRQAHVTWFPSPNEKFTNEISHYVLWRKVRDLKINVPPRGTRVIALASLQALYDYGSTRVANGDRVVLADSSAWDYIATVPAHAGFNSYGYVAPTLSDSNATGMNYTTFMVTAYDVFHRFVDSQADSGYSVDNIAPMSPMNFTARSSSAGVLLSWEANEDEDLAHYALYKGMASQPFAQTTEISYLDIEVASGLTYDYRLSAFDVNGNESASVPVAVTVEVVGDPLNIAPAEFALLNNYPNPFNPATVIGFQLPVASTVTLALYNSNGQLVKTLISGKMSAGSHRVVWEGTDERGVRVANGVYVVVLRAGEFVAQRKLVLLK